MTDFCKTYGCVKRMTTEELLFWKDSYLAITVDNAFLIHVNKELLSR